MDRPAGFDHYSSYFHSRENFFVKPEPGHLQNAHRILYSVWMTALVLHHADMETAPCSIA
jgi:hypothetical protein